MPWYNPETPYPLLMLIVGLIAHMPLLALAFYALWKSRPVVRRTE